MLRADVDADAAALARDRIDFVADTPSSRPAGSRMASNRQYSAHRPQPVQ